MRGRLRHRAFRFPGRAPAAGLTLVELLVVIAVVALLAGLLLAAAWTVRQRARVAQCTVNLQQLGMAIAVYVNDYQAIPLVHYNVDDDVAGHSIHPPNPPPNHDAQMVMGDYVSSPATFYCPVAHALWPSAGEYMFNDHASGLRLSQVHMPAGRALVMYDQLSRDLWSPHLHRYNALFLDGHVKAYDWIHTYSPWDRNADWPPD